MKFLYSIVLLFILIAAASAAVSAGVFKDPAHPGKCVVNGVVLSPGEEAQQPSVCGRMICGEDGYVQFHTCGVEVPPSGYKLGEPINPAADYPKCCKRSYVPIV